MSAFNAEKEPVWYKKASTAAQEHVERAGGPKSGDIKKLNEMETRVWYQGFISVIPDYAKDLEARNASPKEIAQQCYEVRHCARMEARERMEDRASVELIQARDQFKYGNKDGPTFEQSLDAARQKVQASGVAGKDLEKAVCKEVIASSQRTDPLVDRYIAEQQQKGQEQTRASKL